MCTNTQVKQNVYLHELHFYCYLVQNYQVCKPFQKICFLKVFTCYIKKLDLVLAFVFQLQHSYITIDSKAYVSSDFVAFATQLSLFLQK